MIKAVIFDMYGVIINPEQGIFSGQEKPFPEVIVLIEKLSHKLTLGLVSSAPRSDVEAVLKEFGIEKYFKKTVSGNDVSHNKPDPEPYLLMAQKLELQPGECVVIEDSASGVHSAKVAGMHCIGITTTHTRENLKAADLIINNFREITEEVIIGL
ncbi:MAG: HAD-IA family hydrolase [Patescibacteria group bacterium]